MRYNLRFQISVFSGPSVLATLFSMTAMINLVDANADKLKPTASTVNPAAQAQFAVGSKPMPIPPGFNGVHYPILPFLGEADEFENTAAETMIDRLNFQSLRGPGGTDGNFYLFKEGIVLNSKDPRYKQYYGDKTVNLVESTNAVEGKPKLYLEDILAVANRLELPYAFNVNVSSQDAATVTEQIQKMVEISDQPLYIEMGNELYGLAKQKSFPTIRDYVAKVREIHGKVKQIDPNLPVGIVATGAQLEARVMADPNNFDAVAAQIDQEHTQGGRIAYWNKTLAENPDIYDAVIVHIYAPVPNLDNITPNQFMRYLLAFNERVEQDLHTQGEQFGNKPFWVTEWGVLPSAMLAKKDRAERSKYQFMKSPGIAIHHGDRLLRYLRSGRVEVSSYHDMLGRNGFGVVHFSDPRGHFTMETLEELPNTHVFGEVGRVIDSHSHFHPIEPEIVGKRKEAIRFTRGWEVNLADVDAFGFGDDQTLKEIVFINRMPQPYGVKLDGYQLAPRWEYGGPNPFPEYKNYSRDWTRPPAVNPDPVRRDDDFSDTINLKPFSITTVVVQPVVNP